MRIFFSGGTLPTVPEKCIESPDLMLSYYNDVKNGKINTRMRRLLRKLRKEKRK